MAFTRSILVLLLFFASAEIFAQITIRGKVTDASNGEALFGVVVGIKATGTGTTTDFDGAFTLNVNALPVTLEVSLLGYVSQQVVVNAEVLTNIKLSPNEQIIGEVNVTGDRILEKQNRIR